MGHISPNQKNSFGKPYEHRQNQKNQFHITPPIPPCPTDIPRRNNAVSEGSLPYPVPPLPKKRGRSRHKIPDSSATPSQDLRGEARKTRGSHRNRGIEDQPKSRDNGTTRLPLPHREGERRLKKELHNTLCGSIGTKPFFVA